GTAVGGLIPQAPAQAPSGISPWVVYRIGAARSHPAGPRRPAGVRPLRRRSDGALVLGHLRGWGITLWNLRAAPKRIQGGSGHLFDVAGVTAPAPRPPQARGDAPRAQ